MAFRTLQLISLFLIVNNANAQFGEIASIVTGLLGSGAGLGKFMAYYVNNLLSFKVLWQVPLVSYTY
jgi:hypothetical protein